MRLSSILCGLLLVGSLHLAQAQTIRYVRANGTNTNPASATSWATATADLQGAINAGLPNDRVWIAGGTYKPGGSANTNRAASFYLQSGISIYGGFVGTETTLSQRPVTFPSSTTLSGEIGDSAVTTDNCYHVLINDTNLAPGTTLDGVVVSGGRADSSGGNSYGGGLINAASSNQTSSLTLLNCLFTGNYAAGVGGALVNFAYAGGSALINATNCTFSTNVANYRGGAVFNGKTDANLTNAINQGQNQLVMTACQFTGNSTANTAGQGGAIHLNSVGDATVSTFNRCRFELNTSAIGGVLYNLSGSPVFKNCGFIRNYAINYGGVIYTYSSTNSTSPSFINCSFTANPNRNDATAVGAVLFVGLRSNVQFTNSIIFGNSDNNTLVNEDPPQSTITATSSLFDNTVVAYTGTGNTITTTTPFSNTSTLAVYPCTPVLNGSNSIITPAVLGSTDLAGNTRYVGNTADLGAVEYQSAIPPIVSAGIISTNGATGIVGVCTGAVMLAIQSQNDGFSYQNYAWETSVNNGEFTRISGQIGLSLPASTTIGATQTVAFRRVSFDCSGTAYPTTAITFMPTTTTGGVIGGPPIVPFPQETPLTLTSLTAATGVPTPLTLVWQQSLNNSTWDDLPNSNTQTIGLPTISNDGAAVKPYYFRRVISNACSQTAASPVIVVKVVPADGVITGRVVSGDGFTPVASVTLTAVRTTTGLAGSPGSMTYTAVTGNDGTYTIAPVYYGVNSSITPTGSVTASNFVVTPRYTDPNSPTLVHVFSPASQTTLLNQFTNPKNLTIFRDLTTFAISGQTRQTCPDCITGLSGNTPQTGFIGCPVDSVVIKTFQGANQIGMTKTGYLDSPAPGDYGRFAATINNPGTYTLTATANKLVFVPAVQTVNVSTNVYNLNFDSPTSQTIQGRVSAGCGEAIGSAVLEFTDVLKDATGNDRPSCFKKRVTTSPTGYYQVILPPRIYKVTALSLSPNGSGVAATDFIAFVNTQLPADSLTRDLTSTTAIVALNLVYERPPTLAVEGLVSPAACGTASAFSVMQQSVASPLAIKIYQGPVNKGCPVSGGLFTTTSTAGNSGSVVSTTGISGTLIVATTVQRDNGETFRPAFVSGVANLTLLPGEPNVAAPYTRSFTAQFTDKFGRAANPILSRNIVVTGAKSGTQTFETITPALPLFVLHDPPGDGSFSFREQAVVSTQSHKLGVVSSGSGELSVRSKLGIKAIVGIGFSTETAFQLLFNEALEIGGGINSNNEWVATTTTTNRISTSNQTSSVGDDADVVVGAAYNMLYSVATEISLTNSCSVTSRNILAIAPDKVATDYYYTVRTIRDQVIPNLQNLFALTPATDSVKRTEYTSQISLWQQILTNNDNNKAQAQYELNKTFSGGTQFSSAVASLTAQTYALEWTSFLSNEVSVGLGLKAAGNEADFLAKIKYKLEVNGNTKTTNSTVVTTGYTLIDANIGDRFTVDVGKDPVYSTPVFRLLAGESSCPPEAKTRPRDNFEFSAPITVVSGVPAGGNAVFTLKMSNISEVITDPSRSATIELVAGSNPDNATVRINGSDYSGPVTYSLARLAELTITILVRQGNPNIYAYEGLKFKLSASCGGSSKTITLSAYFQNPCSTVSLITPEPNWVTTIADNNSLPVLIGGYTLANLTNVSLEYTPQGASSWRTAFTRTAAQLNNSVNGTLTTWNTTGLPDGAYDLRLKLTCATGNGGVGTAYSTRASGIVDRTPPDLFGIPQPANGIYVIGNVLGANYDEPLACSRIKNSNASVLTRRSNGQVIPATVGCSGSQVVIVPTGSLAPYIGEVLSVTMTGIADVYGNVRTTPDIWNFTVGSSTAATGATALSVVAGTGGSGSAPLIGPDKAGGAGLAINEDAAGTMNVVFRLPQTAPNNTWINFSVAGTASYGVDYTTTYSSPDTQPLSATVNGAIGTVIIPAGASSVTLLIDPIADTIYETDETVIISLLDGGDYGISAASSVTATILNDDPASNANIITSVKTGNWEDPETWDLVRIPLAADEVILDQTHTVTLSTTGNAKKVTPKANAKLRLPVSTAKLRLGF